VSRRQAIRREQQAREKARRLAAIHARWDREDAELRTASQALIDSETPEQRAARAAAAIARQNQGGTT
jgi:hypothetical protein